MKIFMLSLMSLFFIFSYQNCKKVTDEKLQDQGLVEFSFSPSKLKGTTADSGSLQKITSVLVTLQDLQGNTIKNSEKIELYNMNGYYISKPTSLVPGGYKLTRFLVMDVNNNVLYASPLEGSAKAYLLKDPLPISFNIQKDKVVKLSPEVIATGNSRPEDFGYATFEINISKTFDFLLGVFVYNDTTRNFELTNANIKVLSDTTFLFSRALNNKPAITNTITLPEGFDRFTLEISKPGYEIYRQTFIKDVLRLYYRSEDKGPLIVTLKKSTSSSNDLIAYYKLDGNALDYSGNNNNGIIYGAIPTIDRNGNAKNAYEFNGSYILVPKFGNSLPTHEISVSLWAKTLTRVSNFALLLTPDTGDRFGISINYSHNGVNSIFWDFGWEHTGGDAPGRLYSLTVPFDTSWHHYAVIASNSNKLMKIFKDGLLIASKTDVLPVNYTENKDLRIGSGDNANYFNGMLDEIKIYNRVLSESEIKMLSEN